MEKKSQISQKIKKFNFAGVCCSNVKISDVVEYIRDSLKNHNRLTITCINAHIFNLLCKDVKLLRDINDCDLVCADGMPIVWLSGLYGIKLAERCNMTDLFNEYLASAMPKHNCILVGCSKTVAQKARDKIHSISKSCNIIECISGFLEMNEYITLLEKYKNIDCIFVGMGSPKSEQFISIVKDACPNAVIWHIGGGTINFFAGELVEAPLLMRKIGMQWLHRLCMEPGKMWKRYILGNPEFLFRIINDLVKNFYRRAT
ncbi:MAG: WecB/TagA/CpsF family glycosyltransferase [Fibrobacter sp.]|nr:WecB/TagA/CpsF family glycosyltransferase [Fibrobacter sp.]